MRCNYDLSDEDLVEILKKLPIDRRKKIFKEFCRTCNVEINGMDWNGGNYCDQCSPEPIED